MKNSIIIQIVFSVIIILIHYNWSRKTTNKNDELNEKIFGSIESQRSDIDLLLEKFNNQSSNQPLPNE